MKSWQISRRRMLKGMGVLMGLPLLEAMKPFEGLANTGISTAARSHPVRMAFLYMANGINPYHWVPKGQGREFELAPILDPLAKVKNDILVLTHLWNKAGKTGDGHYAKTGSFLTSTVITRTTGSNLCSGNISVDQVAAKRIGHFTRLPSLELGIEPVSTGVDTAVGFTKLYGGHISWSTPTTPISKEIDPRQAFDRLFRAKESGRANTAKADKSILDAVREDAKALQKTLGKSDQAKLDEYFEAVRAVETRIEFDLRQKSEEYRSDRLAEKEIQSLGERIKSYYDDPAAASTRGVNHTEHVRLMLDIMLLAFWTDSTRVSTFMFGNAVSTKNFSFLEGVNGSHHQISHHENDAEKLEAYKRINTWHIEQYAYLLEKMKAIREGESTLLDNSMILFGAGMRDGNQHSPHDLPLVLAGKGGGTIATGRHVVYRQDTPLSNLYVGMLNRMGTPVEQFADSTGELPGLDDPNFKRPV